MVNGVPTRILKRCAPCGGCQVSTSPSGMMLDDVMTRDDFKAWAVAFYFALYHGTELEDVCNTCAVARSDNVDWFYSDENISSLWGTTFPGVAGTNDRSVAHLFDSARNRGERRLLSPCGSAWSRAGRTDESAWQ